MMKIIDNCIKYLNTQGDWAWPLAQLLSIFTFLKKPRKEPPQQISEASYYASFDTDEKLKEAYERAWESKKFEIENYWKRANYFWALQVAAFAGYFTVTGSEKIDNDCEVLYYLICIGFITSFAWVFINIGSKSWQRHWEKHVDLLEDRITGPLYKTVMTTKTFSVSKINDIVSRFFVCVWLTMGGVFLEANTCFGFTDCGDVLWPIFISTGIVAYFSIAMYLGHGRGRFGAREVPIYRRETTVAQP